MASVVEHKKYVFCSHSLNSNKVWEVLLFNNDDVEVRYGRIGKTLQSKLHPGAGRSKMESLIRDKTRPSDHYDGGCYREIETLDSSSLSPSKVASISSKTELKQIAKTQIATCAITQKLIEFFTDVNAHDIYKATGGRITYDVSAGTFKTPIGVVTKNNIINARDLLDKLTDFVNKRDFSRKFITTLEDYLMLIPQDVGRKFDPTEFCGDVTAIQKQSQILDGLESSVQAILSSPKDKNTTSKKAETPELFQVKLKTVDESREIARIQKYFDEGRKGVHVSSRMRLQQVYSVDMITMKNAYEKDGKNMKNIQELWHGTKPSNILSILKSGFIIPPATASHVCGRLYGNGVYFSNSSTKSLNYSTSYWGGKDEGRYFMFLCDVALGEYYIPKGQSQKPPPGYDSFWAKAGKSGVINDELIVFRTSQILPKYITEWR